MRHDAMVQEAEEGLDMTQKVHVRFEGVSYAWEPGQLGLQGASPGDEEVKRAVARLLDVGWERLAGCAVVRPETGHLIVRPQAVYG